MSKGTKQNPFPVLFTNLSVPLSETNKNPGSSQKKVGYLCLEREIFSLCYCCVKEENKSDKKKGTFTSCPQETKLSKGRRETISGRQKKRSNLSSVNNVMYYLKQLYIRRIWEVNTIKFTSFSTCSVSSPQVIPMCSKQSLLITVLIVIHRKLHRLSKFLGSQTGWNSNSVFLEPQAKNDKNHPGNSQATKAGNRGASSKRSDSTWMACGEQ